MEGALSALVMPLYPVSLQIVLEGLFEEPLKESLSVRVALSLLSAGGILEAKDWCHVDIKPNNVMLDDKGGVIMIDYGSAVKLGDLPIATDFQCEMPPPVCSYL